MKPKRPVKSSGSAMVLPQFTVSTMRCTAKSLSSMAASKVWYRISVEMKSVVSFLATTNPFVKAARSSVQAKEPAFPSVMPLKEELSTPWVNLSMAKVILLPLNIVPLRNRHRRSLIVSLLIHHWKQVSFPLTPCSQSAVVSVN